MIYNRHDIYASFMDKWVGRRYDSFTNPMDTEFSPYSDLMLSAGYTLHNVMGASSVSLRVNADNLLDVNKLSSLAGSSFGTDPSGNSEPLYWTVAGRSVIATLSAKF